MSGKPRFRGAATIVAATLTLSAAPALGHGISVNRFPAVTREPSGLKVQVRASVVPLVTVTAATLPVDVLAPDGQPLFRFSSRGVELRGGTPFAEKVLNPFGAPECSDGSCTERWVKVSDGNTYTWPDPRLDATGEWTIGVEFTSGPETIAGTTRDLEQHGHLQTELVETPDLGPGVTLRLLDGRVPAYYLENRSQQTIDVFEGTTKVISKTSTETRAIKGWSQRLTPELLEGDEFVHVSDGPIWTWLAHEARVDGAGESVQNGDVVHTFVTRFEVDGKRVVTARGRVRWFGPSPSANSPFASWPMWIAASICLIALIAGLRWRRNRAGGNRNGPQH